MRSLTVEHLVKARDKMISNCGKGMNTLIFSHYQIFRLKEYERDEKYLSKFPSHIEKLKRLKLRLFYNQEVRKKKLPFPM